MSSRARSDRRLRRSRATSTASKRRASSYVAATRTTGVQSASELTDAGRAKHAEMLRAVQAFNQRLLAGFSAD